MRRNVIYSFIILVMSLFIGISGVKGIRVGDKVTVKGYPVKYTTIKINSTGGYSLNNYNVSGIPVYCIDINRNVSYNSYGNYYVDKVYSGSDNANERAYYAGLSKILTEGYNGKNSKDGYTTEQFYASTSIAVRAFIVGVFGGVWGDTYSIGEDSKVLAHINLAKKWLSDTSQTCKTWKKIPVSTETDDDTNDISNEDEEKEIVYETVCDKYYTYSELAYTITGGTDVSNNSSKVLRNMGLNGYNLNNYGFADTTVVNYAKTLFYHGLEAAYLAYSSDSGFVATSVSSKEKNIQQGDYTTNESTGLTSATDKINITFNIKNLNYSQGLYLTGFDCPKCAEAGIKLDKITISDSGVFSNNAVIVGLNENVLKKVQSQGSYYSNDYLTITLHLKKTRSDDISCDDVNYTLSYRYYNESSTVYLLKPYTTAYQKMLYPLIRGEDDKWDYGSVKGSITCPKAPCDTKISTPICSTNEDEAVSKIETDPKIKRCILNNNDDAGNTYQYTTNNSIGTNSYCSVYCKEDYEEIRLTPIIENVICGGYFQLTAHVKGTKSCYTSSNNFDKSINRDQFIEDVKEAQQTMVDAMNQYKMYQAMLEASNGTYWRYYPYVFTWDSSTESGKIFVSGSEVSGYIGSINNEWRTNIEEEKNQTKEAVDTALDNYKRIITEYNSCTMNWENEFKFSQRIKFKYTEKNEEVYYSLLDEKLTYLSPTSIDPKELENISEVCLGDTNINYECLDRRGWLNINDERVMSTKTFVVCDTTLNECKPKGETISNAKFVRKIVTKEQNYTTPSLFYQLGTNGKIATVSGYSKGISSELLNNVLPVSTKLTGWGTITLNIEDLGEFYNSNDVGRLIDKGGDNEEKSVAKANSDANKKDSSFNGEYKCYLSSSCRPPSDPGDPDDPDDPGDPGCPDGCTWTCACEDGTYSDECCKWVECPDCEPDCVNCLFNENELKLNVKTISTTKFDSAKRTYGYNWVTSSTLAKLELSTKKAKKTIEEIADLNETIYNNTNDTSTDSNVSKSTDNSGLAFSIRMTPDVTQAILDYNEAHEAEGGYGNDSLDCYDAIVKNKDRTETTYKNVYCYSELIDELYKSYKDEITTSKPRPSTDRNSGSNEYWTLWDGYVYDESVIGGPSWK